MNRSFLLHPERQVSQRHDERTPATRGPEGEFCAGGTLDQYTASAMLAPAAGLSRRTEMSTQLQQKVGNQAVRHLIGTRLSLSSSGNVEEFEADQVAARAAFTSERGRGQSDHVAGPPKGLAGLLHRAVDTAPARPAARLAHEAVPREGGRSMDA